MFDLRRAHQAVPLAKVINKTTAKKVWEWVWEIDKEVATTSRMKVEV